MSVPSEHSTLVTPASQVALVAVDESDLEVLVAIRIESMRESLERIGRFDPVRAGQRLICGFKAKQTCYIAVNDQRVGFIVVKEGADSVLLDHLYIRPQYQGRGIGSVVLTEVIRAASAKGLPVRVGALRGSAANRFYLRHGFTLVEQSEFDNYYVRPAAEASLIT